MQILFDSLSFSLVYRLIQAAGEVIGGVQEVLPQAFAGAQIDSPTVFLYLPEMNLTNTLFTHFSKFST